MKTYILTILLIFCFTQIFHSQEDDGVVSLVLPIRNSLTFNRFAINPTFSFVREQSKYVSIYNKREWVQFDDAPLTYLASYSGRFKENIGAGLSLFQQNYGVLTTFGGILNFAYNARLGRENNLTFGLNVGAYKSGINTSNVVTNFSDPSIQNTPENFLLSVNPGINFGTDFFDFGVSVNNLVLYNFETSEIIEDNPSQSIQGHIMYTGYMASNGFFDESKFSGLVKSEFNREQTIISALAMVTVPKGIWGQVGYNTKYGISGGIGINVTKQIALEYNYEKALGNFNDFGPSHDFTLAYRIITRERYYYGNDDEITGVLSNGIKRRKSKPISAEKAAENKRIIAERRAKAKLEREDREARLAQRKNEEKVKKENKNAEAETVKKQEEQNIKEVADAQAKLLAEQKAKEEAEAQAKLLAEQKAKEEADLVAQSSIEDNANNQAITNPQDELGKSMLKLSQEVESAKETQNELLKQFDDAVAIKNQNLKDLKEENDLSEQGIVVQPKPFKSVTAENNALQAVKVQLDEIIKTRGEKIDDLKKLYDHRSKIATESLDEVNLFYRKEIERLTAEQLKAIETRAQLENQLEEIRIATEFEKRRRIKRAAFDNEEKRYAQDRALIERIRETTPLSDTPFKTEDFDFGENLGSNIKILKNINNVESGYYLIVAVHTDIEKRNEFITKVVASGRKNIDFFYDVNTSKYYIYYDKFDFIEAANSTLKNKGNRPYNVNMSLVKIENQ